jgi:hypothetical protein
MTIMKRITLFFALLVGLGLTSLSAQTCAKSASSCAKKCGSVAKADGSADAAAKLASLDATIETRTCEKTGGTCYVRKETDAKTGAVVFTSVEYNSDLGKFVNVSPTEAKAAGCSKSGKTGCCASKAKATSADAAKTTEQTKIKS